MRSRHGQHPRWRQAETHIRVIVKWSSLKIFRKVFPPEEISSSSRRVSRRHPTPSPLCTVPHSDSKWINHLNCAFGYLQLVHPMVSWYQGAILFMLPLCNLEIVDGYSHWRAHAWATMEHHWSAMKKALKLCLMKKRIFFDPSYPNDLLRYAFWIQQALLNAALRYFNTVYVVVSV